MKFHYSRNNNIRIIVLLVFSLYISEISSDVVSNWTSIYHDSFHSSCGFDIPPIVNDPLWSLWERTDNSTIDYNIIILSDQSYIAPTYNNVSDTFKLQRFTYNASLYNDDWINSDFEFTSQSSSLTLVYNNNYLIVHHLQLSLLLRLDIENGNTIWNKTILDSSCKNPQFIFDRLYLECNTSMNSFNVEDGSLFQTLSIPSDSVIDNKVVMSSALNSSYPLAIANIDSNIIYILGVDDLMEQHYTVSLAENTTFIPIYRSVATRIDGIIVAVVCVNGNSVQLQAYGLYNLRRMRSIPLFDNQDCSYVVHASVFTSIDQFTVSISLYDDQSNKTNTFIGKVNSPYTSVRWSITNQPVSIIDITMSGDSNFYICTADALYLADIGRAVVKTLSFQSKDAEVGDVYRCRLSNSQSALMAITANSNATTNSIQNVLFKVSDSLCLELCEGNTTCQSGGCNCLSNYYPSGVCDTFCTDDVTCSGNGNCQSDGTCHCFDGTGYYGDDCGLCTKGYFGPSCNFHIQWKIVIIAGVISFLVTSSICIFACVTSRQGLKRKCGKWRKRCCCCIPSCDECGDSLSSCCCSNSKNDIENESLIKNQDL